jgi:hypothetical protein
MKSYCRLLTLVICAIAGVATAQPLTQLQLPARPAGSMTGTQFKDYVLNMSRDARETAIYREIIKGNVPDFIRTLKPVTITATINSSSHTVTFYVVPEYMSIGSDADYFRMPMTPILAQWVADAAQCSLPTRKMVDAVYAASTCKLAPSTIPPSAEMITVPVFWDHNVAVQSQRNGNAAALGALVGGDKKDVVISPQLVTYTDFARVAIYGWHQLNGVPIQGLVFVHESTYADYSHGSRLVNRRCLLDGNTVNIDDVLKDGSLGALLNDEASAYTTGAPPRYVDGSAPNFPYSDAFPSTGRQANFWINRFTTPAIGAFSPTSPGGDGYVLTVKDPSGGIDTTRIGDQADADYFVQCDIYCEYRPALAADGFERVGIFARDDGNGLFCGQNGAGTIKGSNYCLTWDSKDGRVQCINTVNGVPTDLLPAPQFQPSSSWRTMRIEAIGNQLTFKLDGVTLLTTTNTSHPSGTFGIGFQEQFTTNANLHGTRADNFSAGKLTNNTGVTDWAIY